MNRFPENLDIRKTEKGQFDIILIDDKPSFKTEEEVGVDEELEVGGSHAIEVRLMNGVHRGQKLLLYLNSRCGSIQSPDGLAYSKLADIKKGDRCTASISVRDRKNGQFLNRGVVTFTVKNGGVSIDNGDMNRFPENLDIRKTEKGQFDIILIDDKPSFKTEEEVGEELYVGELPCSKKKNICFVDCKSTWNQTPASLKANADYKTCRQKCREIYNCNGGSTAPKVDFKGMVRQRCGDKIGALNACMSNPNRSSCRSAVRARFAPCENAVRQEISKLKRQRLGLIHEDVEDSVGSNGSTVSMTNIVSMLAVCAFAGVAGFGVAKWRRKSDMVNSSFIEMQ